MNATKKLEEVEGRLKEVAKELGLVFEFCGDTYRDGELVDWRIQIENWPALFFVYPRENGFLVAARFGEGRSRVWEKTGPDGILANDVEGIINLLRVWSIEYDKAKDELAEEDRRLDEKIKAALERHDLKRKIEALGLDLEDL